MFQFLLYVCTLYFTLANLGLYMYQQMKAVEIVRGDRYSRAILMPIYGDLYQIKL